MNLQSNLARDEGAYRTEEYCLIMDKSKEGMHGVSADSIVKAQTNIGQICLAIKHS
jgi:hypothetical protein